MFLISKRSDTVQTKNGWVNQWISGSAEICKYHGFICNHRYNHFKRRCCVFFPLLVTWRSINHSGSLGLSVVLREICQKSVKQHPLLSCAACFLCLSSFIYLPIQLHQEPNTFHFRNRSLEALWEMCWERRRRKRRRRRRRKEEKIDFSIMTWNSIFIDRL